MLQGIYNIGITNQNHFWKYILQVWYQKTKFWEISSKLPKIMAWCMFNPAVEINTLRSKKIYLN